MAIVAVLAGIVSVLVSGSGQTSKDTRSKGDATSIESALAGYLGSRGGVEVLIPKVATVLGRIEVKQVISTNWPENYISDTYSKVWDCFCFSIGLWSDQQRYPEQGGCYVH